LKKFYIETFGCQMNNHDSEKVIGLLELRGYQQVEQPEDAELVLYNTCSIRDKAEQKVYHRLDTWKRQSRDKVIGVLGCVAQQEGEKIFEKAPHVSLVAGSASYNRLPELLVQLESGQRRVTGLSLDTEDTFDTPLTRRDNHLKAFITIIEGCDKSCAYCVVPMTRGPERSRDSAGILAEARQLAGQGYSEIMLLGQNVNSYRDPSAAGLSFAALLRAMGQVDGIRRVRYTTSHPRDFSRDIIEAMDENPVLCNHIHLPVQSGSTAVLERMQRLYTREDYLRLIDVIKSARREYTITSDIIVGFPGETDADFQQTLELLSFVEYDAIFSFKYSQRPNTPALRYEDHLSEEEKSRRLTILMEHQRSIQMRRNGDYLGRRETVLVEGFHASTSQWSGKTAQFKTLNFSSPQGREDNLLGSFQEVLVSRAAPNSLAGELIPVRN
jgi:tRNA-2-methylthio-N6-dimethylallyladenosine synthase